MVSEEDCLCRPLRLCGTHRHATGTLVVRAPGQPFVSSRTGQVGNLSCYLAPARVQIRLRQKGGHGGHNGLRSIIDRMGGTQVGRGVQSTCRSRGHRDQLQQRGRIMAGLRPNLSER